MSAVFVREESNISRKREFRILRVGALIIGLSSNAGEHLEKGLNQSDHEDIEAIADIRVTDIKSFR